MTENEEPGEQGDVLWQNPVRFAPEVEPRVARIVRHKVTYAAGYEGRRCGERADEIHVETFSRDARGRSRWCDATTFEEVAILKAALASAHMVLDAHREDEKRRRDAMIEALQRRRIVTASNPHVAPEARVEWPEPNGYEKDVEKVEELRREPPPPPRCLKPQEASPFGCALVEGHAGECDPDIPF